MWSAVASPLALILDVRLPLSRVIQRVERAMSASRRRGWVPLRPMPRGLVFLAVDCVRGFQTFSCFLCSNAVPITAAPLNLANSPSLHLLTPAEQTLCSQLRILPKPYLVIKETLVREYARRGGKLRRREARDLVKIDVNKTSRVWDFLVQAGFLRISAEPVAASASAATISTVPGPSQDSRSVMTRRC